MTNIFNGTPHAINIVAAASVKWDAAIRKHVSDAPEIVTSIPTSGMLSAVLATSEAGHVDNIPVFLKDVKDVDPLPDGYDVYIVSALYGSAARHLDADISKLFTVADPVYSPDGRTILGSLGICPMF